MRVLSVEASTHTFTVRWLLFQASATPASVDDASRQSDSQTVTSLVSKQSGGFDIGVTNAGECHVECALACMCAIK